MQPQISRVVSFQAGTDNASFSLILVDRGTAHPDQCCLIGLFPIDTRGECVTGRRDNQGYGSAQRQIGRTAT